MIINVIINMNVNVNVIVNAFVFVAERSASMRNVVENKRIFI